MKLVVALAVFFLAASLTAQVERALTPAQCQADQRLWFSMLEDHAEPQTKVIVLGDRLTEMDNCRSVDPDNTAKYDYLAYEITSSQATRMSHFLARHNLWKQFVEEDDAGKR